jgi:hypothetical protein
MKQSPHNINFLNYLDSFENKHIPVLREKNVKLINFDILIIS